LLRCWRTGKGANEREHERVCSPAMVLAVILARRTTCMSWSKSY
jgi:hypothetical protein